MKPEEHAWRALNEHAAAQLRSGFAARALRAAHGPSTESWQQLQAHAAAQLRPSFASRVLRAARNIPGVPSLLDQFAFSIGTAVVCTVAVFFFHARASQLEDERNLASWQQLAQQADDDEPGV
jgi:hypothetical protein